MALCSFLSAPYASRSKAEPSSPISRMSLGSFFALSIHFFTVRSLGRRLVISLPSVVLRRLVIMRRSATAFWSPSSATVLMPTFWSTRE